MNPNIKQNSSKLFYEGACGSCAAHNDAKLKESAASLLDQWHGSIATLRNKVSALTLGTLLGCSLIAPPLFAQEDTEGALEEIVVTGIVGSIQKAADIKRDSQGVVDAITAEGIGKFPDTNLAESLQRISGVSIDRANNEGSKITVRGFGPDFNLVTMNGRQMATASLDGFSRSFDFADLASEGISAVEVHKTFQASSISGGIGSLINIKTAKPLEDPNSLVSGGFKMVMDTSVETGSSLTPEFSGIYTDTFAENTIGVGVIFSHQTRDSRTVAAEVANDWTPNIGGFNAATLVDNRPEGSNFWTPQNYGIGIEDIERVRTNAHLVFQWAPLYNVTATADYTYAEFANEGLRNGVGVWFGDASFEEVHFNSNGSAVYLHDTGDDYAYNKRLNTSENMNSALGFNVQWQATGNIDFDFDWQNSSAESRGTGRGNDVFFILASVPIENKIYDARAGNQIPGLLVTFNPDGTGIVDGNATADSIDSLFAQAGANVTETDVTQSQFHGKWENTSDSFLKDIQFGFDNTDVDFRSRAFNSGQLAAGWYGGNQNLYDNSLFQRLSTGGLLSNFSGGDSFGPGYYFDWNFPGAVAVFEKEFNNGMPLTTDRSETPTYDHRINEGTTSPYAQANMGWQFLNMDLKVAAGLRQERTSVVSNSLVQAPLTISWTASTEYNTNLAEEQSYSNEKGDYNLILPSVDASLAFLDNRNLISRFSYSTSVTRASLPDLQGTLSVNGRPKPGDRTANSGNPDLDPFTSDNLDLSAEWYYNDTSYVAGGFFRKSVENFIVVQEEVRTIGNLRDPRRGPRAAAATAALQAAGTAEPSDLEIFQQINRMAGVSEDAVSNTAIEQTDEDPLIEWRVSTPTNLETATLYGWEFAFQHVFGDTGFGVQGNMTLVDGDLDVDVSRLGFQFVLPGLSDSYNLIGFYEKHSFQVRLAYNYRDEFLSGLGGKDSIYFTEEFGQMDLGLSYRINDSLIVSFEGLNVTGESQRVYNRYREQIRSATQYEPRYNFGVRYTFDLSK